MFSSLEVGEGGAFNSSTEKNPQISHFFSKPHYFIFIF